MPRRKGFRSKNRKQSARDKRLTTRAEIHLAMTSRTRELLHAFGLPPEREQEVEFFFYTSTPSSARRLTAVLREMEYDVSLHTRQRADLRFAMTGMTTKMRMDDRTLQLWTQKMCGLAEQYGCVFDGWGTVVERD